MGLLRRSAAVVGLIVLGTVSGCGSPSARSAQSQSAQSQSAAPQAHRAGLGASPRSAVPAKPPAPCTAAQLTLAPASRIVRDGLEIERFTVTDTASAGCTVSGMPQLMPYGPLPGQSGGPTANLAASENPFPDGSLPKADADAAAGGDPITLEPKHSASFELGWYSASTVVCEQVTGLGFDLSTDPAWSDLQRIGYALGALCDGLFYVTPFS